MLILTNELHFQNDPKSRDAFRSGFAAFICEGIERQVIFAFFFFHIRITLSWSIKDPENLGPKTQAQN